jgi:hypothetical protein
MPLAFKIFSKVGSSLQEIEAQRWRKILADEGEIQVQLGSASA